MRNILFYKSWPDIQYVSPQAWVRLSTVNWYVNSAELHWEVAHLVLQRAVNNKRFDVRRSTELIACDVERVWISIFMIVMANAILVLNGPNPHRNIINSHLYEFWLLNSRYFSCQQRILILSVVIQGHPELWRKSIYFYSIISGFFLFYSSQKGKPFKSSPFVTSRTSTVYFRKRRS